MYYIIKSTLGSVLMQIICISYNGSKEWYMALARGWNEYNNLLWQDRAKS